MMAGAGLAHVEVTPEVMETVGRIFREVVSGLMGLLRARRLVRQLAVTGETQFADRNNNPLKFSATVEEALYKLFVLKDQGYMPPLDAFQMALSDMEDHQAAMLHGMRAAFAAMTAQFDPSHLEEHVVGSGRDAWARYRAWFEETVSDGDRAYSTLFGRAFADAYAEALEDIAARRAQGRR